MLRTRRAFVGAVAGALALAGCTGDEGEPADTDTPTAEAAAGGGSTASTATDATETATDAQTEGTTAEEADGEGATVQVRDHADHGEILVDGTGMTLYMFDADTRGEEASTCYDDCAGAWPPLTVDGEPTAAEGVTADLATFDREDGSTQVAAGGWPLYYFASDGSPGDATGQGVNDVWWVLRPDGTPVRPDGTATTTETDAGY